MSFGALIGRDMRLAWRGGGSTLLSLAFFATVITLVPLGIGPQSALLRAVAGGIVMLCAALIAAVLLPPSRADEASKGRICYARKDADGYLLHVMDPDGKSDKLLANQPGKVNMMPAWSPRCLSTASRTS